MLLNKVVRVLTTIPVLALRFPGSHGSHISIQSALEGSKTAFTPQVIFVVLISIRL
jgi:hypothetical protein